MRLPKVTKGYQRLQENSTFLWKDILDLGIVSCLAFLRKKKTKKMAFEELKKSLFRQSEEHWNGLYRALKRLK